MSTPLSEAIDIAVKGGFPDKGSKLDGKKFYIRSIKNKNRLEGGETSYFRHQHRGKDDRIFYSIKLGDRKGQYQAKITRIQFRGPWVVNGFRAIGDRGVDVTDIAKVAGAGVAAFTGVPGAPALLLDFIKSLDLQSHIDGDWLATAAKVVDMIGKRMAQDIR